MATIDVDKANRNGRVFLGGNIASTAISAVGASMTGLILYNPAGSNRKMVLLEAGWAFVTSPAGIMTIGLALVPATNSLAPTSQGVSTVSAARAADGSNFTSYADLMSAATYAAPLPVACRWSFQALYQAADATLTTVYNATHTDRVDGSIVLVPGASVMLCMVGNAPAGLGSFVWAEYPM